MKLLLVNPNTSTAMTAAMAATAQAVAAPGTVVVGCQLGFGPASIEGHFDEAFGAAGGAAVVHGAAAEGFGAVVIAGFGDPGLDAARKLTTAPVLGIPEAAFQAMRCWRRSKPPRARRWCATAARPSCWAAAAWPRCAARCSRAWACRWSTASAKRGVRANVGFARHA